MIPDINIPILLFLVPYILFILGFFLYGFFNIYNLLHFGVYNFGAYLFATIFIGGSILFLGISFFLLINYDWNMMWSVTEIFQNKNNTGMFWNL
ncbi:MAG: hypothetical protein UU48_C0009G0033 [Candidatus Uhrbacteria bacterium GW2011_GWF2_41_16]|jgi:hypothetical protein|uniref:Uncharacterized protein n=2 Tax=Candidatus Uhriibacteriota TaxID=1752732 RepID=A0A0G0VDN6_9BACT|nr:MAG: hypothetical protein UU35_C0011G0031 [Candidatus Uhrbacteria bacterium GW2011_GWC2_41_11]KKR97761.1 MAG: hypothetical protein UU48_C0009G0033 [Candidatus Uhrbacteria bacterium GW2011_GWF2_41_16]HBO99770.1 hypothetical protein [Candidatus Uhrbacteria bacterium]